MVILLAVYQVLPTFSAKITGSGKDLLAKSGWVDIGCWHRALSFLELPAVNAPGESEERASLAFGAGKTKFGLRGPLIARSSTE